MRRKRDVEMQLEGLAGEIDEAAAAANVLIGIRKNGLADARHMRDFWERQL